MRKLRTACQDCPARTVGICASLSDDELAELSSQTCPRQLPSGRIIHAEGETPRSFCAVISGVVKLTQNLQSGAQQIVGLAGPGDLLGRPFGGQANASAIAAGPVMVCWFPRALVETLAARSDAMKRWLYQRMATDLEQAQSWITLLGRMTAEQRIASFLLSALRDDASDRASASPSTSTLIELPLSRTEIADYLGLTIETVSRQIARLREKGVISVGAGRRVLIHRPDALAEILGGEEPHERRFAANGA
jgi:CRP/FNR family transcriptional regulator